MTILADPETDEEEDQEAAMAEANEFVVDTGRGYSLAGRVSVDHDNGNMLDIEFRRTDGQPFKGGNEDFSLTLSIDEDLT